MFFEVPQLKKTNSKKIKIEIIQKQMLTRNNCSAIIKANKRFVGFATNIIYTTKFLQCIYASAI